MFFQGGQKSNDACGHVGKINSTTGFINHCCKGHKHCHRFKILELCSVCIVCLIVAKIKIFL